MTGGVQIAVPEESICRGETGRAGLRQLSGNEPLAA